MNKAISELLISLNERDFKKKEGSRRSWYEEFENPKLKPLPELRYVYRIYKKSKVNIDYHIELENHCYSVPYKYIGKHIDVWYNNFTVSCYYMGELLAEHIRSNNYGLTTVDLHMPKEHSEYHKSKSRENITYKASVVGNNMVRLIEKVLDSTKHEEQSYRTCLGILSLTKKYTKERIESACQYAYEHNILRRKHIKNIIESDIDKVDCITSDFISIEHSNIRGAGYYH